MKGRFFDRPKTAFVVLTASKMRVKPLPPHFFDGLNDAEDAMMQPEKNNGVFSKTGGISRKCVQKRESGRENSMIAGKNENSAISACVKLIDLPIDI